MKWDVHWSTHAFDWFDSRFFEAFGYDHSGRFFPQEPELCLAVSGMMPLGLLALLKPEKSHDPWSSTGPLEVHVDTDTIQIRSYKWLVWGVKWTSTDPQPCDMLGKFWRTSFLAGSGIPDMSCAGNWVFTSIFLWKLWLDIGYKSIYVDGMS